jgi:hypothetical protein
MYTRWSRTYHINTIYQDVRATPFHDVTRLIPLHSQGNIFITGSSKPATPSTWLLSVSNSSDPYVSFCSSDTGQFSNDFSSKSNLGIISLAFKFRFRTFHFFYWSYLMTLSGERVILCVCVCVWGGGSGASNSYLMGPMRRHWAGYQNYKEGVVLSHHISAASRYTKSLWLPSVWIR